jgi:hypothetical protein
MNAPTPSAASNGMGTAGLVLGIIGLVLSWVPAWGLLLGVLAATFGAIGYSKARRGMATNSGSAIAGLVMGILATVPFFLFLML